MSDLDYWKEMKLVTTERVAYFEDMLERKVVTSKWIWFVQRMLQTNRSWNKLADKKIETIDMNNERKSRFRHLQVATFRANDDE